jgi:hypothetical protein
MAVNEAASSVVTNRRTYSNPKNGSPKNDNIIVVVGQEKNWNNPEFLSFAESGVVWTATRSSLLDHNFLVASQTSTTPILSSSSFQHRLPVFTPSKYTALHVSFSGWDRLANAWATASLQDAVLRHYTGNTALKLCTSLFHPRFFLEKDVILLENKRRMAL